MPFYPLICFNYLQIHDALHRRIDDPRTAAETREYVFGFESGETAATLCARTAATWLSTGVPAADDAAVADDGGVAEAEPAGNAAHNGHEPKRAGIPGEAVRLPRLVRSRLQPRSIKLQLRPYA
jgi:hypothetical protein